MVATYAADPGRTSLSGTRIPRVTIPRTNDAGELVRYWRRENLPGRFPFTAGVFPHKRQDEDPARMFAGEGDPFRTNRRFKLLSEGQPATRLSTAFDSVTLYGRDPATPPDVYGKVGTSGVSVATLDDMKALYDGFDLSAPSTSVSMTINGPAPTVLAFFLNTAIDQAEERFRAEHHREPNPEERADLRATTLRTVRGTVQADILKEDQGQNTCLFSTEFSLRCMADIQEWFIQNEMRNFYSVSISGYHMAEAGANPISQLAFTLANAFTYVETYLARGMDIDDFAPNLSFFFSNGMDPEYTVLGRVARRIWAIAMREKYHANERSQKLKYHVQTSGRSLHAQEMAFNDIRTTLQALLALQDNANSLHTNAYDEAVTTPTDESVRRALAIQLVINREFGWSMNENPLQGSYLVDELTDLVEAAVLVEFDRISERGGVLGAMETGYQRGRIQDESMLYEQGKHDGTIPIIGVNTFINPGGEPDHVVELRRASDAEKQSQLDRVTTFRAKHQADADEAIARLKQAATSGENIFDVLMDAARVCTPRSGDGGVLRGRRPVPKERVTVRVTRIVSGGQTGADRAALDVAIELGIDYGGWCPAGGRAEDFPEPPGLLAVYPNLTATDAPEPAVRTRLNVRDSDATLIVWDGRTPSPGTQLTMEVAQELGRPLLITSGDVAETEGVARRVSGSRRAECRGPAGEHLPGHLRAHDRSASRSCRVADAGRPFARVH